ERRIALDVIDARWKEHLYLMDQLREGIWTVGIAQNNALVEFKLEGFRMFDAMVESIKEQIAEFIFRVQIEGPVEQTEMRRTQGTASHQSLNALSGNGQAPATPAGAIAGGTPAVASSGGAQSKSSGGASRKRGSRKRRR
ncbi:MAG: preprotein translocase subunit SecA, partial [Leptospiraceae bacterium]|nr:preprotein translocase subunit SecA [Leptospiraceae bacterium]